MADRFGSDLIDARTTGDGPVVAPSPPRPEGGARRGGAATALEPVIAGLLGPSPAVRFVFWDGTGCGPAEAPGAVVVSPGAIRRLLWAPGQLGLGRAYVAGELDFEGDLSALLERLRDAAPPDLRFGWRVVPAIVRAAVRLGAVGPPPAPPPE